MNDSPDFRLGRAGVKQVQRFPDKEKKMFQQMEDGLEISASGGRAKQDFQGTLTDPIPKDPRPDVLYDEEEEMER